MWLIFPKLKISENKKIKKPGPCKKKPSKNNNNNNKKHKK